MRGAGFTAESQLQSAVLAYARFEDVRRLEVVFDASTMLPDGTFWTPETEMDRFIDPDHEDFYQPG